jgi:hypothetical protein
MKKRISMRRRSVFCTDDIDDGGCLSVVLFTSVAGAACPCSMFTACVATVVDPIVTLNLKKN